MHEHGTAPAMSDTAETIAIALDDVFCPCCQDDLGAAIGQLPHVVGVHVDIEHEGCGIPRLEIPEVPSAIDYSDLRSSENRDDARARDPAHGLDFPLVKLFLSATATAAVLFLTWSFSRTTSSRSLTVPSATSSRLAISRFVSPSVMSRMSSSSSDVGAQRSRRQRVSSISSLPFGTNVPLPGHHKVELRQRQSPMANGQKAPLRESPLARRTCPSTGAADSAALSARGRGLDRSPDILHQEQQVQRVSGRLFEAVLHVEGTRAVVLGVHQQHARADDVGRLGAA